MTVDKFIRVYQEAICGGVDKRKLRRKLTGWKEVRYLSIEMLLLSAGTRKGWMQLAAVVGSYPAD